MRLSRASYLRDRAGVIHIRCRERYPFMKGVRCEPHLNGYAVEELSVVKATMSTCMCCVVCVDRVTLERFTGV